MDIKLILLISKNNTFLGITHFRWPCSIPLTPLFLPHDRLALTCTHTRVYTASHSVYVLYCILVCCHRKLLAHRSLLINLVLLDALLRRTTLLADHRSSFVCVFFSLLKCHLLCFFVCSRWRSLHDNRLYRTFLIIFWFDWRVVKNTWGCSWRFCKIFLFIILSWFRSLIFIILFFYR